MTSIALPDGDKVSSVVNSIAALNPAEVRSLADTLYAKFGVAKIDYSQMNTPGPKVVVVEEEEQTEFTPTLMAAGDRKLEVIKAIREITGLGLKESKELVDTAPSAIKESISKEDAEKIKTQVEAVGGKVEIK